MDCTAEGTRLRNCLTIKHAILEAEPRSTTASPSAALNLDQNPRTQNPNSLRKVTLRTPMRVANVSMPFARSPSTSGKSFVMAMTTANKVTKDVMNLQGLRGNRSITEASVRYACIPPVSALTGC